VLGEVFQQLGPVGLHGLVEHAFFGPSARLDQKGSGSSSVEVLKPVLLLPSGVLLPLQEVSTVRAEIYLHRYPASS